ncbi:ankyrin repeat domain-containing protein [Rubripirellula amarantea]|nr:ankyrin repeat domain-containing protein [Rubripirellula amarantea]
MRNERDFIDAIVNGDDSRLAELLCFCGDDEPLVASIAGRRPTNHAVGFGMTLLQLASIRERKPGNPSKLLIDHGATVDLHSACGLGMIERIEQLLHDRPQGVSDQVDTYFPMQFAVTAGRPEVIQFLVKHGDDVNRNLKKVAYFGWEDDAIDQDYTPWKLIHMASLWGFDKERVPVAAALASVGADLNALCPLDGFRPIHLAAMASRVEMIKFFASKGVDVDSRTQACSAIDLPNENGPLEGHECTALMVAAAEGFPEAIACLLELGADPMAVNSEGYAAIDFAERRFWDGQPYDFVIDTLKRAPSSP